MSSRSERVRLWVRQAADDLAVARLVYQEDYFSHACFLAQQSIEKALKGYLIGRPTTIRACIAWPSC